MIIENILWDLDGTLTDSKKGIINCIRYALDKFGKSVNSKEDLNWCLEPPLYDSFSRLVPNASYEEVLTLVKYYRERFSVTGMFENDVYQDIPDLFSDLQNNQKHLRNYLATSKLNIYAKKILSHFNLIHNFTSVHGSELNGERSDKGELITYIINTECLEPNKTVMIGDRKHDIVGAKKAGIRSIGITWGYGTHEELQMAGAEYIFSTPRELKEFLIYIG